MNQELLDLANIIRDKFKGDQHQPVSEKLAFDMIEGIDPNASIALFDAGCVIALTLLAKGHNPNKITVVERKGNRYYHDYSLAVAKRFHINHLVPEMNNIARMNKQFDYIIGNPPYQDPSHESKRWVLWHKFVEVSIENSDRVQLIVPASITSPGKMWNLIRRHLKELNLTVKDEFPSVASTFCSFVYDKNFDGNTKIITDDGVFYVDVSSFDFLPPDVNEYNLGLYNKFSDTRVWKISTEYHRQKKSKWEDDNGNIEVWHTNAKTYKTNVEHYNNSLIRVGVTLSGHPKFKVMHNMGATATICWTPCRTLDEAQELAEKLNGAETQELLKVFKWSGWNLVPVIQKLG